MSASGKRAVISGEVEIVVVRSANGDRYWLRFEFPNGRKTQREDPALAAAAGSRYRGGRVREVDASR